MAEVNDRGQLLLVAGVLLAVMFVALALLINAAIYTDNVATRGGDSAGEALEYQAGAVETVGGLIDAENAVADSAEEFSHVKGRVETGVPEVGAAIEENHLKRAATTEVELVGTTEGRLIRETDTDGFESWEANASAVRGFAIDLDTDNMSEGDPAFRIDLNGTELEVNKTDGNVTVEAIGESLECTAEADGVIRFDVTGERLDGDPCRFGWPTLNDDSEIRLEDAENGAGTYELTIQSEDDTAWLPPGTTVAVYSVDLELRMWTRELRYETTVRVAPGEANV